MTLAMLQNEMDELSFAVCTCVSVHVGSLCMQVQMSFVEVTLEDRGE